MKRVKLAGLCERVHCSGSLCTHVSCDYHGRGAVRRSVLNVISII